VLAPESDIKLTRLEVFTFPRPTSWRPDRNEEITSLSPYVKVSLTFYRISVKRGHTLPICGCIRLDHKLSMLVVVNLSFCGGMT